MAGQIILIRHGRSAHVEGAWLTRDRFLAWRRQYDEAGIADAPPEALRQFVAGADIVLASTTRRALDSARALAPEREIATDALFCELDLIPPRLGSVRLPLTGWAIAYGVRFLFRAALRAPNLSRAEERRLAAAVTTLETLAERHARIVVVTHGSFRVELTKRLRARGWQTALPSRHAHWSAWILSPRL